MPEVLGLSRSLLRLAIGGYHEGITMAGLRRLASLKLEVQVTFGAPAIPVACSAGQRVFPAARIEDLAKKIAKHLDMAVRALKLSAPLCFPWKLGGQPPLRKGEEDKMPSGRLLPHYGGGVSPPLQASGNK